MLNRTNRAILTECIEHEQFADVHLVKFRTEACFAPEGLVERSQCKIVQDSAMAGGKYRSPQGIVLGIPMLGGKP
ncbi:MAG: hypothetical protein ACKOYI_07515, partial [Actinomycetota bacterium]